jgi:hypothetical protein
VRDTVPAAVKYCKEIGARTQARCGRETKEKERESTPEGTTCRKRRVNQLPYVVYTNFSQKMWIGERERERKKERKTFSPARY